MNTNNPEKKFFINSKYMTKKLDKIIAKYVNLLKQGEVTREEGRIYMDQLKNFEYQTKVEWYILFYRSKYDIPIETMDRYEKKYREVQKVIETIKIFLSKEGIQE